MNYKINKIKPFGVVIEAKNKTIRIDELDINKLQQIFNEEQLIILRGFDTFKNSDDFSGYCERWGEISIWPFGKVLELKQQEKPQDHIFDNSYVPLHWDGMYRSQVPEYQVFHCLKAPLKGYGGRTTFSNTILALNHLPGDFKKKLNEVTGIYQRKMEFYNSKIVSPIITKHPLRNFLVIRYNEPHFEKKGKLLNIPNLQFTGIEVKDLEKFHSSLIDVLYNSKNFYAHEWQDNDVLIADNFSLLHGREEFVSHTPRHLQRVQVLSNPPYDNPQLETFQ